MGAIYIYIYQELAYACRIQNTGKLVIEVAMI